MKKQHYLNLGFVFTFTILCFSCKQDKGFEINGSIAGLADSTKVMLTDAASGKAIDSTFIQQNHFQLKGKLIEAPALLKLTFSKKDDFKYTALFIGNETVQVEGSKSDFPEKLVITGSQHQAYKNKLDSLTADLNISRQNYLSEMFSLRNSGEWNDSLQAAFWSESGHITQIDKKTSEITNRFIAENLNSDYALAQLIIVKTEIEPDTLQKLYKQLTPEYKNSKYGKVLTIYLANPQLKVNDKFYDFEAEDQNGKQRKLSDFVGDKYILLDFASAYCSWCKKALPLQKELAEKLDDELQLITFYVDKNKEDWIENYQKENIGWPNLWNENGRFSDAFTKYGVSGTPTYFLIDKDGVVVGKWDGYQENLDEEIIKTLHK